MEKCFQIFVCEKEKNKKKTKQKKNNKKQCDMKR
jgi:hypothetical protein